MFEYAPIANIPIAKGKQARSRAEIARELLRSKWLDGDIDYLLHEGQKELLRAIKERDSNVYEVICYCARRFGKSYFCVWLAIYVAIKIRNKPQTILLLSQNIKAAYNIVKPLFRVMASHCPDESFIKQKKSMLEYEVLGSTIKISSADKNFIDRLRGLEAYCIIVEESAFIDDLKDSISEVLMPTMLHNIGLKDGVGLSGVIIHATTPSKKRDSNYILDRVKASQGENPNVMVLRNTIYNNPLLTKDQIEIFKSQYLLPNGRLSDSWKREALCEDVFTMSELGVFYAFSVDRNTVSLDTSGINRLFISVDLGGVLDKTGILLMAVIGDNEAQKVIVLEERLLKAKTTMKEIVSNVRDIEIKVTGSKTRMLDRFIDCTPQQIIDLRNDHNFIAQTPKKLRLKESVNLVNDRFREGLILIDQSCTKLKESLLIAEWNKQGNNWTRSEKYGHFDLCASLVYGVINAHLVGFSGDLASNDLKILSSYNFDTNEKTLFCGIQLGRGLNPSCITILDRFGAVVFFESFYSINTVESITHINSMLEKIRKTPTHKEKRINVSIDIADRGDLFKDSLPRWNTNDLKALRVRLLDDLYSLLDQCEIDISSVKELQRDISIIRQIDIIKDVEAVNSRFKESVDSLLLATRELASYKEMILFSKDLKFSHVKDSENYTHRLVTSSEGQSYIFRLGYFENKSILLDARKVDPKEITSLERLYVCQASESLFYDYLDEYQVIENESLDEASSKLKSGEIIINARSLRSLWNIPRSLWFALN